jgi:hypothetical protein
VPVIKVPVLVMKVTMPVITLTKVVINSGMLVIGTIVDYLPGTVPKNCK